MSLTQVELFFNVQTAQVQSGLSTDWSSLSCAPVFVSEMICIRNNEVTSPGLSYQGRADLGDAFEGSSKQFVQQRAELQILKLNKSVWTCGLHHRPVWMETCTLLLL